MMVMSSRLSLTAGASSRRPSSTARASRMASTLNTSMSTTGASVMSVHHAHDVHRVHVLAQAAHLIVLDLDDPRVPVVVVVAVAELAVGLGLGADQIAAPNDRFTSIFGSPASNRPRTGARNSSMTASPPSVLPAPGTVVAITSQLPSRWISWTQRFEISRAQRREELTNQLLVASDIRHLTDPVCSARLTHTPSSVRLAPSE